MEQRIIFHVDVNNAFLSWEAAYRLKYLGETLDLRTVPSAVSGSKEQRHGIILAKSAPAKLYKVKTAETVGEALKKCPDLILVPPRYSLYEKCSQAFMDLLREYSDLVEPYSIDEAFVDMTGCTKIHGTPVATAHIIKDRIRDELGFTVNIGVSENKLLAKMASDFTKGDKVHTLFKNEVPEKMWPLPVSDLFFVGRATTAKLKKLGISTIGELAAADPSILRDHFGKNSEILYAYAHGDDPTPVVKTPRENKGYGNSVTIDHDVTDADEAKNVLLSLCETVGARLRKDNVSAGTLSVSIRDCFLEGNSHQMTLPSATCVTTELYHYSCKLFDELWNGSPIRQLGVHTSKVTQETSRQLSLFDSYDYVKQSEVEKSIDAIRDRFGRDVVMRASLLKSPVDHMAGGIKREKFD